MRAIQEYYTDFACEYFAAQIINYAAVEQVSSDQPTLPRGADCERNPPEIS